MIEKGETLRPQCLMMSIVVGGWKLDSKLNRKQWEEKAPRIL
jgi:hypothetical protein